MPTESPAGPSPSRLPRIVSFERLRIVAALGIVYFHTQQGVVSWFALGGLPVFVMLLALVRSSGASSLRDLAVRKSKRLLLPWSAWALLYLLADLAIALHNGEEPATVLSTLSPLYGTRIHLWFLPFAFVATLGLEGLRRVLARVSDPARWLVLVAAGAATFLGQQAVAAFFTVQEPLPQILTAVPALFWGLALDRPAPREPGAVAPVVAASSASFVLALVAAKASLPSVDPSVAAAYGAGLVCVWLATAFHGRAFDPFTRAVAPLTYGIYLSHPFVALVLYRFPGFDLEDPLHGVLLLFVASALLTAALRRLPLVRRTV